MQYRVWSEGNGVYFDLEGLGEVVVGKEREEGRREVM